MASSSWPFRLFLLSSLTACVHAQQAPNPDLDLPMFTYPNATTTSPYMKTTGTFRNDFCDLSNQVTVTQTLALDDALRGTNIHVALMQGEFANFDVNNDDGSILLDEGYPGLVPRLLDEICERAGCTWRDTYAAPAYSERKGRSYTDLLKWSIDVYDIQGEWWMRSIERLQQGATFTEPWYDGTIIMVAPKPDEEKDEFDPWAFMDPFDKAVWIMVLVTIVGSGVVHWILHLLDPNREQEQGIFSVDPIEAMWLFGTAFVGQFEFDPQTGPQRLFTFSGAFWGLLLTSAYTANLASFLVIRNTPAIKIESIQQAINTGMTMCIEGGSGTHDAIKKAFPTYAASDKLVQTDGTKAVYQGLRDGDCEIAITEVSTWDVLQFDKDVNGDCSLGWIGRPFQTVPASFAVKSDAGTLCTSLLRDVFNLYLHRMEVEGTIEELWDEHIQFKATVTTCSADQTETARRRLEQRQQQPEVREPRQLKAAANAGSETTTIEENPDTTKLTLTNMGGVFMIHGILSLVSVLCALVPWFLRRYHVSSNKDDIPFSDKKRPPSTTSEMNEDEASADSLYYFDAEVETSPTEGTVPVTVRSDNKSETDILRAEMNAKLASIDLKLAALLDQ